MGSYRARGTSPGFSQWLIVADLRPLNSVIAGKFNRLQGLLAEHEDGDPGGDPRRPRRPRWRRPAPPTRPAPW